METDSGPAAGPPEGDRVENLNDTDTGNYF